MGKDLIAQNECWSQNKGAGRFLKTKQNRQLWSIKQMSVVVSDGVCASLFQVVIQKEQIFFL